MVNANRQISEETKAIILEAIWNGALSDSAREILLKYEHLVTANGHINQRVAMACNPKAVDMVTDSIGHWALNGLINASEIISCIPRLERLRRYGIIDDTTDSIIKERAVVQLKDIASNMNNVPHRDLVLDMSEKFNFLLSFSIVAEGFHIGRNGLSLPAAGSLMPMLIDMVATLESHEPQRAEYRGTVAMFVSVVMPTDSDVMMLRTALDNKGLQKARIDQICIELGLQTGHVAPA